MENLKQNAKKKKRKKNAALNDWDDTPSLIIACFDELESVLGGREALQGCQYKEI